MLFPPCCWCEAGPYAHLKIKKITLGDLCFLLLFYFGNMLYFLHCLNNFILVYRKNFQHFTLLKTKQNTQTTKKKHKSSKHPMHKPRKRRFHFLVVRAALSVLQQMSLLSAFACLSEVAKEEIKFVSFAKCKIFAFLRTVTLLYVILLP